ncbi:hypothetical protein IWZ00DRAFT_532273 [Phyllosticta capitalensis]
MWSERLPLLWSSARPPSSLLFFSPQHQRQPLLHPPNTSAEAHTINSSSTNLHKIVFLDSVKMNDFQSDTSRIQSRLVDAKNFGKSESKRLTTFACQLQEENNMLQKNLEGQNATITVEVRNALQNVPLRCLPYPAARYFDDLMPVVADYIETYDIEHSNNPGYMSIWNDMARAQATENGLLQCAQLVKDRAMDNYRLRKSNVSLSSSEEKVVFEAALGEPSHPATFVRHIPYEVSSTEETPVFNILTSIREFEEMSGGKDLVLEEGVLGVAGCEAMAYHPLSTVYVPSFPGVPCTTNHVKLADPVTFYDLDNYLYVITPSGARLWVKKTGQGGVWVYP